MTHNEIASQTAKEIIISMINNGTFSFSLVHDQQVARESAATITAAYEVLYDSVMKKLNTTSE